MAERRMLCRNIAFSDDFNEMPSRSKNLYVYMMLETDDDGFVAGMKRIAASQECSDEEIKILIDKGYILMFESGVAVIRHWHITNQLVGITYTPTIYQDEYAKLVTLPNGIYSFKDSLEAEYAAKYWIKQSKKNEKKPRGREDTAEEQTAEFTPPTKAEAEKYCKEMGYDHFDVEEFLDYNNGKNWIINGDKVTDWKPLLRNWAKKIKRDKEKETKVKPANSLENQTFETNDFFNAALENSYKDQNVPKQKGENEKNNH